MKIILTRKTTLITGVFILFLSYQNIQAQFFKKILEKAENKIEREAENRAERRVNKKIDKAFDITEEEIDGVGDKKDKSNKKRSNQNNTNITSQGGKKIEGTYHFSWKYVLQIDSQEIKKNNQEPMLFTYYLNPNSPAFASSFIMNNKDAQGMNMLTLMNPQTGLNIMLMNMDGKKIAQKMPPMNIDKSEQKTDVTVEKIGTKTIMGFNCQGFKAISKEGTAIFYIAPNTPVSFNVSQMNNNMLNLKGFNAAWFKEYGNGLMMEMQFTGKKKKHNLTMICVALEKAPLTIDLSQYQSF